MACGMIPTSYIGALAGIRQKHVHSQLRRRITSPGFEVRTKPVRSLNLNVTADRDLNQPDHDHENGRTDLKTLYRSFLRVGGPYWATAEEKHQARLHLALVFALTFITTGVRVGFSFLGRIFDNALTSKNKEQFVKILLGYLAAMAAGIPIYVFQSYTKELLALRWRAWMTKHYMKRYLSGRAYYRIQCHVLFDNPDQRVVDDIDSFTQTALSFSLTLLNAAVDLLSFTSILYRIYPPLFAVLLLYSVGGTMLSFKFGKDLTKLNFMREKTEADFRYSLVRVRDNSESVAFYGGESNELNVLLQRFRLAFANYTKLLRVSRNLEFFQDYYNSLIHILPAAVVAPLYFRGKLDFGVISQSCYAFSSVLSDLSIIVNRYESLSSFSAVVHRLGEFNDILDEEMEREPTSPVIQLEETADENLLLQVKQLTLSTPQGTLTLFRDLCFSLTRGQRLLVTGPSGSGKTSLLRAVAGLWTCGEGSINTIARKDIFFLPQKPYMVLGTLREQLLYPTWSSDGQGDGADHEQPSQVMLLEVMRKVKLGQLMDRYDLETEADWSLVLSLGEQQRLAFARLLLSGPELALLDEATSAVDEETEAHLYGLLSTSHTSVITVGHRNTLRQFHTHLLSLDSEIETGGDSRPLTKWSIHEIVLN